MIDKDVNSPLLVIFFHMIAGLIWFPVIGTVALCFGSYSTIIQHRGNDPIPLDPIPYPKCMTIPNMVDFHTGKGRQPWLAWLLASLVGIFVCLPLVIVFLTLGFLFLFVTSWTYFFFMGLLYTVRVTYNVLSILLT